MELNYSLMCVALCQIGYFFTSTSNMFDLIALCHSALAIMYLLI